MMALVSDIYQISSIQTNQDDHQTHMDHQGRSHEQLLHVIDPGLQQYPNDTLDATLTLHSPKIETKEDVVTQATNNNDDYVCANDKTKKSNRKQKAQRVGGPTATRFKWTKEMMQVAMNLLKYGCKPKLISVAVGCSIRTAQKFAETVAPREEGQSFREYEVKRRGRKHKDTNPRLEAIRDVLNKDCTKTQVEIAANLKVSNTTVCRDLKKIGGMWRDKTKSSSTTGMVDSHRQTTG